MRHPTAVLARNEQAGAHASDEEERSEGESGADSGVSDSGAVMSGIPSRRGPFASA